MLHNKPQQALRKRENMVSPQIASTYLLREFSEHSARRKKPGRIQQFPTLKRESGEARESRIHRAKTEQDRTGKRRTTEN